MKTLTILGLVFASALFAADPAAGRWALNVEKSKLQSPERWKGTVMAVEFVEGTSYRYKFAFANGRSSEEVRNFDGKERPAREAGVTVVYQRKDPYHHQTIQKRGGKEIFVLDASISNDGRTLTAVVKDTAHEGRTFDEVRVYERQ